ncbi:MAG: carbohydrate kinase family protein [Eubacteriales bacterium]|nr:carbohydrate kinase family protein [Eubacteriales bacterium]
MENLNYPEVVAVGHLCMDRIMICEDFPPENTSKHVLDYSQQPGGTASQAIVALARLGIKTGYISPMGDDEVGKTLLQDIADEGVDVSKCPIIHDEISHFTNVLVNAKNNTRTFLSYHGKFPDMDFTDKDIDYISNAKILHLDNTNNANALKAANIAKEHGVLVSLDGSSLNPDNRKNLELVKLVDILITSEIFPTRLTGIKDRKEAIWFIAEEYNPSVLISTCGEEGSLAYIDGHLKSYPSYSVNAVDTTGAGDAFHGAFLFGLLKGYDLSYNIQFSSAVAAINCQSIGGRSGLPYYDDVINFMKAHSYNN